MIDHPAARTRGGFEQGLYVSSVSYDNGFQVGDEIVEVNGARVTTSRQMQSAINACRAGDAIRVSVIRDGEFEDIRVILTEADISPQPGVSLNQ